MRTKQPEFNGHVEQRMQPAPAVCDLVAVEGRGAEAELELEDYEP